MAVIIKTNGDIEPLPHLTLQALQQAVGGWIQEVFTHDGRLMFVHEEGKIEGKPLNRTATRLSRFGGYDPIVGDAVLLTHEETRLELEDDSDE